MYWKFCCSSIPPAPWEVLEKLLPLRWRHNEITVIAVVIIVANSENVAVFEWRCFPRRGRCLSRWRWCFSRQWRGWRTPSFWYWNSKFIYTDLYINTLNTASSLARKLGTPAHRYRRPISVYPHTWLESARLSLADVGWRHEVIVRLGHIRRVIDGRLEAVIWAYQSAFTTSRILCN